MTNLIEPSMQWGSSRRFGNGHNGIDYKYPMNTPVTAAADGVVDFEGWGQNDPWTLAAGGIYVRIRHSDGSYTGYAHLSSTTVNKGQAVKAGQRIGLSGTTGNSTGPHLHFEVIPRTQNWNNGYAARINPEPFFVSSTPLPGGGKTVNEADLTALYKYGPLGIGGFEPRSRSGNEGSNVYLGKTAEFVINDLFNSTEAKSRRSALAKRITDANAERDATARELDTEKSKTVALSKNVLDLTSQLKERGDKLTAAERDLALANDKIKELQAADKPVAPNPSEDSDAPSTFTPPEDSTDKTQTAFNRLIEAVTAWFVSHTKKN